MAADLKSITTFQRVSLILLDDSLVKLEHERTQDRVRRFAYDSIQSVVFWQKISWWRIIVCILVLIFPGIGVFFIGGTTSFIIGNLLIVAGGCLVGWYCYCKMTTIRIVRGGSNYELSGLFRPGKLRKFRERFIAGIQAAQAVEPPALA